MTTTTRTPSQETLLKRKLNGLRRRQETATKKLDKLKATIVEIENLQAELEEIEEQIPATKAELIRAMGLD